MAAPTAPMTTTSNPNSVDRRIFKHSIDTYETKEPKLEVLFNVESQEDKNQYEEDYQGLAGFEYTVESEIYSEDAMGEGFQTIFTPRKYTKRVPFTMEAEMWDKSGMVRAENFGKELGKSAADSVETLAASVFNGGFATPTGGVSGYNAGAKPLFSTLQLRADGGTSQSNASATGITLTDDNLETGVVAFRGQKNHRGRKVANKPTILLVGPDLEKEAIIITKSQNRSGTAENDTNVNAMREYYGGNMKVVVWDYLTSTTAWFLLGDHQLKWNWAKKFNVRLDKTTGDQNDLRYYLSMFYASFGFANWLQTWGSKGDNQAYAS